VSRTGISVQDDARWVFNRLARDYARRPGYPEPLVARLAALAGGPGARVADLGAGTGLLSVPLAEAGLRVWAVEPAREMLRGIAAATGALTPVHAAGEATGLPAGSFDLVVVADALHWMDAEKAGREAARLLRPGGAAAVVVPRLAATPFLDALSARLAAANPRARPALPPVALFLSHAGAAPLPPEPFVHEALLAPDDLDAVLRSLSLVGPALGPAGVAGLLAEARALAVAHGGAVWRREIALHAGRREGAP
jgi:SAM-dependent methyltransferase